MTTGTEDATERPHDSMGDDGFDPFAGGAIEATVPLTEPQSEMWLAVELGGEPANCAYNESLTLELGGRVDEGALERALLAGVARHQALRGSFAADGSSFVISADARLPIEHVDLSKLPIELAEASFRDRVAHDVATPFDLQAGPLARAWLARMPDRALRLVFTAHHLVFDGWSAGVFIGELSELYTAEVQGRAATLDPAPTHTDAARAHMARATAADEAYWLAQLEPLPAPLDLPADYNRPAARTFGAQRIDLELDPALTADLRALARSTGATLFATLFAGFCAFVYRLTGLDDVVIGVPAAGQLSRGEEGLVGHWVNMLPVRVRVDGEASFAAHAQAAQDRVLDAFEHQDFTFGTLLSRLAVARDPSRVPLVPVTFNLDPRVEPLRFGDTEGRAWSNPRAFDPFDFGLNVVDAGERLVFECTFNKALFKPATVKRRLAELTTLYAAAARGAATALNALSLLPDDERRELDGFSVAEAPDDAPLETVLARFSDWARHAPDAEAVTFGETRLTYAALDARAAALAERWRSLGAGPGALVAVCLDRGPDLIATLLAVMKAGAAFLPLDPRQPRARLQLIIDDAGATVAVVERDTSDRVAGIDARLLVVDAPPSSAPPAAPTAPAPPASRGVALDDLAYVLYTSGSTGTPKGVELDHRGLANVVSAFERRLKLGRLDRWLAVTTVGFDIALLELLAPLCTGGAVCLAPQDAVLETHAFGELLDRERVTVLQAVPATWRLLVASGVPLRAGLKCITGGEALPSDLAAALLDQDLRLWNGYGPTEATIYATVDPVETPAPITIGAPIERTTARVLDGRLQPVPIGVLGELWLGGVGLARGYRNRPELTAERFVDRDAAGDALRERLYRTGDLARWRPDGRLEFCGRRDHQVKLRGFRIELGEIEARLRQMPEVREAVVHPQPAASGELQLVAYLVGLEPDRGEAATFDDIGRRLRETLPDYMVPAAHVWLDALPQNANGKVDRNALPVPEARRRVSSERAAPASVRPPRNDTEAIIISVFRELLGAPVFDRDDDFFAMGGYSLLAARAVAELRRLTKAPITLAHVFHAPTPARLAALFEQNLDRDTAELVPIREEDGGVNVFCLMGVAFYYPLASALGPGHSVYAVMVPTERQMIEAIARGEYVEPPSVESLADQVLVAIRRKQHTGPYALAGLSFGGTLAVEVARRLRAQGQTVRFVALFDTLRSDSLRESTRRRLAASVKRYSSNPGRALERLAQLAGVREATRDAVEGAPEEQLTGEDLRLQRVRERIFLDAMAEWDRTRPTYGGELLLFRAGEEHAFDRYDFDSDYGWSKVARGVRVIETPGGHLSLLQKPHVEIIARVLRRELGTDPREP